MILKTFAIKDKALDSYGATFQQTTIEAALRMFKDLVLFGDEANRYRRNPEDFTLYLVGEFDDATAENKDIVNVRISSAIEIITEATQGQENVT